MKDNIISIYELQERVKPEELLEVEDGFTDNEECDICEEFPTKNWAIACNRRKNFFKKRRHDERILDQLTKSAYKREKDEKNTTAKSVWNKIRNVSKRCRFIRGKENS